MDIKNMEIFENALLNRVVVTALIIICAIIVWIVVKKVVSIYNDKRQGDDADKTATSLKLVISDVIKVFVVSIIVLTILQVNGVNVTSLIAGFGVVSAVVGLALQDFFKDIIMGIHILLDDFYKVGDVIQYGEDYGIIVSFNLRTTKLESIRNGNITTLCNRNIVEAIKCSAELHFTLPMPYELSVGEIGKLMKKFTVAAESSEVIEECIYQGISELSNSNVACKVKLITVGPEAMYQARRDANMAYYKIMQEAGIDVPFDKIDVHVH